MLGSLEVVFVNWYDIVFLSIIRTRFLIVYFTQIYGK